MAEINVTPMVDVMLVLLIIFMVAAPLLTSASARPAADASGARAWTQDKPPLTLSVERTGGKVHSSTTTEDRDRRRTGAQN